MSTPLLKIADGPGASVREWTGPWPPPLELLCAVGRTSGIVSWTERDVMRDAGVTRAELEEVADVWAYRRVSASDLPDSVDDMPHVARAALYQLAGRAFMDA